MRLILVELPGGKIGMILGISTLRQVSSKLLLFMYCS